jgi:hypothetical protein
VDLAPLAARLGPAGGLVLSCDREPAAGAADLRDLGALEYSPIACRVLERAPVAPSGLSAPRG